MKNALILFAATALVTLGLMSFTPKEELPPNLSVQNMAITEVSQHCYVISFDIVGSSNYSSNVSYKFAGMTYDIGSKSGGDHYTSPNRCLTVTPSNRSDCSVYAGCVITDPVFGVQEDGCVIVIDGCRSYTNGMIQ